MPDEIDLLTALVAIPSVSGEEEAAGAVRGGDGARLGSRGVARRTGGAGRGRRTRRRGRRSRWSRTSTWCRRARAGPASRSRRRSRAPGSTAAARATPRRRSPRCSAPPRTWRTPAARTAGRLLVLLGYGEETKHTTMERAVETVGRDRRRRRGRADQPRLRRGPARTHDGRPAGRGRPAPRRLRRGRRRVPERRAGARPATCSSSTACSPSRSHPVLGHTTATPTMLDAGVSRNVTPPVAKACSTSAARPTGPTTRSPTCCAGRSPRTWSSPPGGWCRARRRPDSRLLPRRARLRPQARTFGSPTCSDWVFLRHTDAFKCGPGTSRRSHTPDEYVDLPEVSAAARARCYLAAAGAWPYLRRRARTSG